MVVTSDRSSDADTMTLTSPRAAVACTPGSVVSRTTPPSGVQRQTWDSVGSSEATKTTVSSADTTQATCRPGGVTACSPTTSRRVSPPVSSATVTSRPSSSHAGTPGTTSSHGSPRSSWIVRVSPVAGFACRTRIVRWSRVCTTTSGSWPSLHTTSTRYGNASLSHATSTRPPSIDSSASPTSAFAAPAAGYRTADGGCSGCAGFAMCHTGTGDTSTRSVISASPSGDHQSPRVRWISSASTNAARPHVTFGSSSAARIRSRPWRSTTCTAPPLTYATSRPVGSGAGWSAGDAAASAPTSPVSTVTR